MGSRIRDRKTVKKVFECYAVIDSPWPSGSELQEIGLWSNGDNENGGRRVPAIKSIFPASFTQIDLLKSAAQFAFPCPTNSGTVELFTFVLTGEDSKWRFGYCRHQEGSQTGILFLSFLPWQEIFYRLLNYCAEIDETRLVAFLDRLYTIPVPEAGTCLYVPTTSKPFICPIARDLALPSIPENRNVSEFYNALSTESMLVLFAALLSERRIVVTSKKLTRLSSIVMASNSFIFPFCWQHIFIPVLSMHLAEYLSAPMPFLIGVPIFVWDYLPPDSIGQLVRVDADADTVTSPFPEDLESLPHDVVSLLRKNLTGERVLGDGLARAFLRSLAQIMGHYQDAIRDDGHTFDPELFVQFAHPAHRQFISNKLLKLQIFQQFVDEKLHKIKIGECESDEFELEALAWRAARTNGRNGFPVFRNISGSHNRTAIKKAGKAVIMSVKRESGNIIETVKQNSALKSAFRSVKESGKSVKQKSHIAVSDIKSKFHVPNLPPLPALPSSSRQSGSELSYKNRHPLAAPRRSRQREAGEYPRIEGITSDLQPAGETRDDNLLHLMSLSSSSSTMNELSKAADAQVKPRLSRSEENLIDLDGPTGLGFTLENPLYDLASNNSVFDDKPSASAKSDAQLLLEYGLSEYFLDMNVNGSTLNNNNSSKEPWDDLLLSTTTTTALPHNSWAASKIQPPSRTKRHSGTSTSWATFE